MSFLADYLLYASDNEAPDLYHVWAGYIALSAAVSRKVWLPQGEFAIFPNLYVMLVGDAGDGKSTAMRYLKRILALAQYNGKPEFAGIHFSGEIETPEGMWRFMAGLPTANPPIVSPVKFLARWPDGSIRDCHPMVIIASEFIDFIKRDPEGWVSSLNNIYDLDRYHYRTKGQGEDKMDGPYMVLIGGLTTGRSQSLQQQQIIETGLARRTLFQYGQRKFDDPHPILQASPAQNAARDRCVEYLKHLNRLSFTGEVKWAPGSQQWFINWYVKHSRQVQARPPQTKSWFTSKPDQVLKLGILSCLSESSELVLEVPHLELGLAYLSILEDDLLKIFGGAGRNELAGVAMKMFEFIQYLPEAISLMRLRGQFFHNCKPPCDFDHCLQYLIDTEKLQRLHGIYPENSQIFDVIGTPKQITEIREKIQKAKTQCQS